MRRRLALICLVALVPLGCLGDAARVRPESTPAAVVPARTDFAQLPRAPGRRVGRPPVAPLPAPAVAPIAAPSHAPPPVSSAAFDSPLVAATRALEAGRPDAGEHLARLPSPAREVVERLLTGAVLATRADFATPGTRQIQEVVEQVDRADAALNNYAPLVFSQALFVRNAEALSRYTPMPAPPRYSPLSRAELYVELRNARPAPVGPKSDRFENKFRWKLTLSRTRGGPAIAHAENDYAAPVTRSPQRDCWFKLPVALPETPGDYLVTVEVQDLNRPANVSVLSKSLPLTVAGRP